jgi:hypothetical protein
MTKNILIKNKTEVKNASQKNLILFINLSF